MSVKHLDHLNMSVKNFDETVDWYGRVFGAELVQDEVADGVRWGVLKAGEAMLCIYEHPDLVYRPPAEQRERGTHTIAHFGLRIDDRASWEATVERENLELNWGGEVSWPHSTAWYVNDPTGYEIEVALWDDDTIAF